MKVNVYGVEIKQEFSYTSPLSFVSVILPITSFRDLSVKISPQKINSIQFVRKEIICVFLLKFYDSFLIIFKYVIAQIDMVNLGKVKLIFHFNFMIPFLLFSNM